MIGRGCSLSPFLKGTSGLVFSALGNISAPPLPVFSATKGDYTAAGDPLCSISWGQAGS